NNSVILRISPLLKIVSEVPDNIRIILVPVAEEFTVFVATTGFVHQRSLCPPALVERRKHTLQAVYSSLLHDVINMTPVILIGCRQIVVTAGQCACERVFAIHFTSIVGLPFTAISECVAVAQ